MINKTDYQIKIHPNEMPILPIKTKQYFLFLHAPLSHFEICGRLPGKCLQVYLHLIWISTVTKKNPVKAQHKMLLRLGVDRFSFYRSIKKMKEAELIDYTKQAGCSSLITLKNFKIRQ